MSKNNDLMSEGVLCIKKGIEMIIEDCNYCNGKDTSPRWAHMDFDQKVIHIHAYCNDCTNMNILNFKLDFVEVVAAKQKGVSYQ